MKKTLLWFLKAALAGILAFLVVTAVCHFYYNIPVRRSSDISATDYVWDAGAVSSRGTEGFAVTHTDEKGYVNTYPEKKDSVDILIMGSSHAEGFNVSEDENFTYLLNEKFSKSGIDMYAYNIGMSAHTLLRCFNNLDGAIKDFAPSEYIFIETSTVDFSPEELERLNAGEFEVLEAYDKGFLYTLQKSDVIRLLYSQLEDANAADAPKEETEEVSLEGYTALIDKALSNASKSVGDSDVKIVVVYCPTPEFDYNGKIVPLEMNEREKLFEELCGEYGIGFINMFSYFEQRYNATYELPHGFTNSHVGVGHINAAGHTCIANAIFDYVEGGASK